MSPIFILIWVVSFYTGTASGSQEFTNETQCLLAKQALIEAHGPKGHMICVRK